MNLVDTRLTRMEITGQEIMTQDKVGLRINFVCNYRITDYVKILTEIDDYAGQMHVAAQLALRDFVGKQKLDDILANKDELSRYAFERLKAKENEFFVEIIDAGVKDVPQYIFAKLPTTVYTKVEVAQYQKARLYFDQKLIRILDAGTYYF